MTGDDVADVVIVGAGVVGTAIARTLAGFSLSLVLVDAAPDVGTGTSKANTAILHTGFDAKPGSLESRLLGRGSALLRSYAAAAGIPVERTGALLVAWTPEQAAALPSVEANARRNGYLAVRPVTVASLYAREPSLGPGAVAAVEIPDSLARRFTNCALFIPNHPMRDISMEGEWLRPIHGINYLLINHIHWIGAHP